MKMITSYKAFDGTLFTDADMCSDYERDALIEIAETVKCVCTAREECFTHIGKCPFYICDSGDASIGGRCMFASGEDESTPDQFDF